METVLIVVHLMIVLALVGSVLLQRSEGGALGMGGGGGSGGGGFMTGRGTANALTRTTAYLAAAFFATSIALAILASQGTTTVSPFDGIETSSEGGTGGVLDDLQRLQGDAPIEAPASDVPQVPTSR